jgi:hypothetical protein
MSVAGDDLPALQSTEVKRKEVLTLLKLTPDFNACSATERRKRCARLRRELSWIKTVYDLRVSDAKAQLTPSEGAKRREQIAAAAEKLLRLFQDVGDWGFLTRVAKDQVHAWSLERQFIDREIVDLLKEERRTRKRLRDAVREKLPEFRLKLVDMEDRIDAMQDKKRKWMNEIHALDGKRARLGRRLDDSHPEAEEPAPDVLVQEVAMGLEVLIPLFRNISIRIDFEKQIEADARKWVADQLRELALKYMGSRSIAATNGKPGPALRFAESASFVIISKYGIPWPALQEHWRRRPKRAAASGKIYTKRNKSPVRVPG